MYPEGRYILQGILKTHTIVSTNASSSNPRRMKIRYTKYDIYSYIPRWAKKTNKKKQQQKTVTKQNGSATVKNRDIYLKIAVCKAE